MSACPSAPHPAPPHMLETLPPLANLNLLAAAVSASAAHCVTCMERQQRMASENPMAVHQSVALVLMYVAIVLNANEAEPGATCEDMLLKAAPQTVALLSEPTLNILRSIPVEQTRDTPDGSLAARWDSDRLATLIAELPVEERAVTWTQMLGLLLGITLGEGRAREAADL